VGENKPFVDDRFNARMNLDNMAKTNFNLFESILSEMNFAYHFNQLVNKAYHYENMRRQCDEAIRALKKCHRKHNQGDDSIGWEELEQLLHDTLANLMGDKDYVKWVNEKKEQE